uniref:Uncharacterized protein n=1 Tax=Rhizophora mucronata TaxID=61149 RepID=A0A2P2PEU0_RHIMU
MCGAHFLATSLTEQISSMGCTCKTLKSWSSFCAELT